MYKKKKKFTLLVQYKQGTYISQFRARDAISAVAMWSRIKRPTKDDISIGPRLQVRKDIYSWNWPVRIRGRENVWHLHSSFRNNRITMNIVLTV